MPVAILDDIVIQQLKAKMVSMESILDADLLTIHSNILGGLDAKVRNEIELLPNRRDRIGIILYTCGGLVEVAERIADTIRHNYKEVIYLVPDVAMSAGTVLVMSGDRIMMDYFSRLGPIDPQILTPEGKLIPALSYLDQFERMRIRSQAGELTAADIVLLNKLDLAELQNYEQARDLSRELLERWLSTYKFKNWSKTETQGLEVTQEMKEKRAGEIADLLSDNKRWHAHGRGISMETLRAELKLKIDDFSDVAGLADEMKGYFALLKDYLSRMGVTTLVHTRLG